MSITSIDDFVVMILREPFGRAVCPFSFTDIVSEPTHIHTLDPPVLHDSIVPYGKALPANVVVPPSINGKMDDFIDDIITAGYADSNWKRLAGTALISLHILGRPVAADEPIKCDDIVVLNKLKAEETLNEIQTVLGWSMATILRESKYWYINQFIS